MDLATGTVFHDGLTSGGGFFFPPSRKLENRQRQRERGTERDREREMNNVLTKILMNSDKDFCIIPVHAITGALANRHV